MHSHCLNEETVAGSEIMDSQARRRTSSAVCGWRSSTDFTIAYVPDAANLVVTLASMFIVQGITTLLIFGTRPGASSRPSFLPL